MLFYLQRLTVNEANTILSKRRPLHAVELLDARPSSEPSGYDNAESASTANAILSLLVHLTPREREVFVMREVMEMAYNAIAELLNISPVTARRFYGLAKKRLKREIESHHPELASGRSG